VPITAPGAFHIERAEDVLALPIVHVAGPFDGWKAWADHHGLAGRPTKVVLETDSYHAAALAVERGEVMCRAFTVNAFFAREPFITWRKKNFVRVLYQTGSKRDPRLKDVPLFNELMEKYKTPENVRRLTKVVVAADEFGRPLVFPPGVPADRVKIIRDAFNKTINDPALLAEAEKRRLDIDPATGEELDALAKEVMTAPPDVVERVKKLIGM